MSRLKNSETLGAFLAHFRLRETAYPDRGFLTRVAAAFSQIPYENLSKIIKWAQVGRPEEARRGPREVISAHVKFGAGGTCFSLTATFAHILRALGWQVEPILADRHYGENTHCALLVWFDGKPQLLDPGYLIVQPIPIDIAAERKVRTSFNDLVLVPTSNGQKLELYTENNGHRTYRLTFKTKPADRGEFLDAWDASFGWDMMRYPVLTRVAGNQQVYLQSQRLQRRRRRGLERREFAVASLPKLIYEEFGVDKRLSQRALEALRRQGEIHGSTHST